MIGFADNCVFTPTSGGIGSWTVSAAVQGYQTPAQTGQVVDGRTYRYRAESPDKSQWEIGDAVSSSSGTVFSRSVIASSNGGSAVNFTSAPTVALTLRAADVVQLYVQDTAPSGAVVPSLWWQSSTGLLFVNYNDGTSTQWVAASVQATLPGTVQYDVAQSLSLAQKQQAQSNIGLTPYIFRGQIFNGLTLSTAGSSSTFSVSAGSGADPTGTDFISLTSAINKTTGAWAAGTGNGSLDTGTIAANTWYHAFVIKNETTAAVDVLTSLSATTPTLPSGYTLALRPGAMKTDGSSKWTLFFQVDDQFLWGTPVGDVNTTLTTTSALFTLTVPTGLIVESMFNCNLSGSANFAALLQSPNIATQSYNTPTGNISIINANTASTNSAGAFRILTNTSAQIRAVAGNGSITLNVVTTGWRDPRGKVF